MMWKGPELCTTITDKCVGIDKCGRCLERCIFDANINQEGKVSVNAKKCMGCGLCVSTCIGQTREMSIRRDYEHDHRVPAEILTGGYWA